MLEQSIKESAAEDLIIQALVIGLLVLEVAIEVSPEYVAELIQDKHFLFEAI